MCLLIRAHLTLCFWEIIYTTQRGTGGELHYDNISIRATSDCPLCSGDNVVIENTTFDSGDKCWCVWHGFNYN